LCRQECQGYTTAVNPSLSASHSWQIVCRRTTKIALIFGTPLVVAREGRKSGCTPKQDPSYTSSSPTRGFWFFDDSPARFDVPHQSVGPMRHPDSRQITTAPLARKPKPRIFETTVKTEIAVWLRINTRTRPAIQVDYALFFNSRTSAW